MTGPHDNPDSRPISVAELLARSGSIGAPPPGGRRRRRRGNTDAVTVAELTGEIPVANTGEIPAVEDDEYADHREPAGLAPTNGTTSRVVEPEPSHYEPEPSHYEPEPSHYEPEPSHYERDYPQRPRYTPRYERQAVQYDEPEPAPHPADDAGDYEPEYEEYLDSIRGPVRRARLRAAEDMRPDPGYPNVDDDDRHGTAVAEPPAAEADDLPSYLRAEREHLFGGHTRGMTGRGDTDVFEPPTAEEEAAPSAVPQTTAQRWMRSGLVVLQSIVAVAFGAGLFMAFDQLWKWNNIVALVLSVLVILGLVVGVRIVRKTEDIGSTLIAVAVGALVTLGPLALLQSG